MNTIQQETLELAEFIIATAKKSPLLLGHRTAAMLHIPS